jgi:hypothetical protein
LRMSNNLLTWEEVQLKFENLVKFAAKNTYSQNLDADVSVGADDLYQIGMLKLFDCWRRYKHLPMEEFKAIFSKSLFRTVRRNCKNSNTTDIETAMLTAEATPSYTIDEDNLSGELELLRSSLKNDIAVAILSELIDPSPKTIYNVWADRARKMCVKGQGKSVNVPKNNDVKMKHIKDSLEITQKQFDIAIKEIREVARVVMGDELGGVLV